MSTVAPAVEKLSAESLAKIRAAHDEVVDAMESWTSCQLRDTDAAWKRLGDARVEFDALMRQLAG